MWFTKQSPVTPPSIVVGGRGTGVDQQQKEEEQKTLLRGSSDSSSWNNNNDYDEIVLEVVGTAVQVGGVHV